MLKLDRNSIGVMPSSGIKAIGSTDAGRTPARPVRVFSAPPVDKQAKRAGDLLQRRFLEDLDLLHDAYGALESLTSSSDVGADSVYPLLYQLNREMRRLVDEFGGAK